MRTCTHAHTCTDTNVHMDTCTHAHMHTYTYMHTCTHAHICIHVHMTHVLGRTKIGSPHPLTELFYKLLSYFAQLPSFFNISTQHEKGFYLKSKFSRENSCL